MKIVLDKSPKEDNRRNSEGAFIRIPDGRIMFAYGSMTGASAYDDAPCNIAAIYSSDEGETWTEPTIIAHASDFGVKNIMSVSVLTQKDGKIGVYFLIKENDHTSTIGRALSEDGITFKTERCTMNAPVCYYVVNNDRIERFSDGRIVAPAMATMIKSDGSIDHFGIGICLVSDDDGSTFHDLFPRLVAPALDHTMLGFQEPGLFEHSDGTIRFWARTTQGYQYECYSRDGMNSFTPPQAASTFMSPCSPLEMTKDAATGDLYVAYNPIPELPVEVKTYGKDSWGRTPLVVRRSKDDGCTWGKLNIIEADKGKGYCYPSFFFTKDGSMLLAYCRGGNEDGNCLARLGIMKIALDEIE